MSDLKERAARARVIAEARIPPKVAFAYALIEEAPGRYSAVLLEGVRAEAMTKLEVNGQPEPQGRAMMRAISAIEKRTIGKKWSNA
jgi:hypothetical protein